MEFLRHKDFDGLIMFEKEKATGRIAIIQKGMIFRNNDTDTWIVESENELANTLWTNHILYV